MPIPYDPNNRNPVVAKMWELASKSAPGGGVVITDYKCAPLLPNVRYRWDLMVQGDSTPRACVELDVNSWEAIVISDEVAEDIKAHSSRRG